MDLEDSDLADLDSEDLDSEDLDFVDLEVSDLEESGLATSGWVGVSAYAGNPVVNAGPVARVSDKANDKPHNSQLERYTNLISDRL